MKWRQANYHRIPKDGDEVLKELSDSYKELSENYNNKKKETETINKNQKK